MEKLRRTLSAFLALVLVLGMLPMPAAATELAIGEVTEAAETTAQTTAPVEIPAATETQIPETEVTVTEPVVAETLTAETEPANTESEETFLNEALPDADAKDNNLPLESTAISTVQFGSCGENLTWSFDVTTGTLTIEGTGEMEDFAWESPWNGYCEFITNLILSDGITTIGANAFAHCDNLEDVILPESVVSIGDYAFYGCSGLRGVTLPTGLTSIGEMCFYGCYGITELVLPDNIINIGHSAFHGCTNLSSIVLPRNVKTIGLGAFYGCFDLTRIVIPDSVEGIYGEAFAVCSNLKEIVFEGSAPELLVFDDIRPIRDVFDGVVATAYYPANDPSWTEDARMKYGDTINWFAYEGESPDGSCGEQLIWSFNEALGTLTIEGSGDMDAYYWFSSPWNEYRESITSIVFPDGITSIGSNAFYGCSNVAEINIPDGVITIGESAFYECSSLSSITIPESVVSIGDYSFGGCSNLTEIKILDGVATIGTYAFRDCESLTRFTIPGSVTTIGDNSFHGCWRIKKIVFEGNAPVIGNDAFYNITAMAFYPVNDDSWTDDVMQNYGGTITWKQRIGTYLTEEFLLEQIERGETEIYLDTELVAETGFTLPREVTITIGSGGILNITEDAYINCYGIIEVLEGGSLIANGTWQGNNPVNSGGSISGVGLILNQDQLEALLEAAKNDPDVLAIIGHDITLERDLTIDRELTVHAANIIIPTGVTLTVDGELWGGLTIENGGHVIINRDGVLNPSSVAVHGTMTNYAWINHGGSYQPISIYGTFDNYGNYSGSAEIWGTLNNYGDFSTCCGMDINVHEEGKIDNKTPDSRLANDGAPSGEINIKGTLINNGLLFNGSHDAKIVVTGKYVHGENALIVNTFDKDRMGSITGIPKSRQTLGATYWKSDYSQQSFVELVEAMLHEKEASRYGYGRICIAGTDVAIDQDITIPETVELIIGNDYGVETSAYIGIDATITVNGTVTVMEDIILSNHGGISIDDNGCLYNNGILRNDGQIDIHNCLDTTGTVYNGTTVYIHPSGLLRINGNWEGYHPINLGGIVEGSELFFGQAELEQMLIQSAAEDMPFVLSLDLTLESDLTIPSGAVFEIGAASSLTVPQNVTLSISQDAQMNVAGKLYNNGTIQGLDQGIGPEAVIYVPEMGYVRNNGRVIANRGTVVDVDGTWEGNDPVKNGGVVMLPMSFKDFKAQVDAAAKTGMQVELSRSVVLESSLTIPKNVNLRMVNGGTITVPRGKTLTLNGLGNSMMNGCQLIVEEGGKLALNGDMSLNYNDKLIVNGTFTAGKTVNGVLGKVQVYYGSGCEVVGVPKANQALNLMVSGNFDGNWDGYLEAFANNDYGVSYLQIHANVTLDQEMVIPANGELCIWKDQTLINDSTITNYGKINIYEGILDNNGEIHVKDAAVLQNYGTVNNNGHVYAYYGSSISNGGPGIAAAWNGPGAENKDFMTQDQLEAAIANSDSYELNKVVVLERDLVLADKELVIGAEGRLIVPGGKTLTINYATNVRGKLEVEKGGKLVQNDWLMVYPGGTIQNAGTYVAPKNECFLEIFSKQASLPRVEGIAKKYQRVQFDDVDLNLLNYALTLQKDGYAAIRLHSDSLTLNADVTIPKVITLVAKENLTVNGNLILNGTIVVDNNANLVNNGSFTMNKGSELYFYGTWEGKQPINKGGITYPHATAAVIAGEDTLTLDVVQAAELELAVSVSGNNTPQYGSNYLQFVTWTSSNKKVVDPADIIFEDGVYKITRAGVGTTKLTAASVATDAKGKTFSDTVTLTVTDIQATGLTLAHDAGENSTPEQVILVKNGEAKTFTVTPEAMTAYGTAKPLTGKDIKWTVSNSKLAAIKANADGSATVTVKAGASGEAVITAQLTAQKDMTANLDLAVMDYQPRLEKNAFTMNSRQENPTVTTRLTEQEKTVTDIRLYEYSKAHKGYLETESQRFEAVYENGLLTITKTDGAEEKNAVQLLMQVDCEGVEEPFGYELKITMKNAVPAVTVKQPAKFNLFYTDSRTGLEITAKDARVTNVTIRNADAEQFAVESFDEETGILTLKLNTYSKKPDAKLDLLVELEGFGEPVVKSVSVGTASVKPSLILSPASSTIYTVFGADEYYFSFKVCDKTTGAVLDDCFGTIRSKTHKIEAPFEGGELNLTTTAEMADTLTVMVQKENWSEAIQLTHSLKVDKNAPKIKLSTSTVKFNTFFYNERTEECSQVQTVQVTLDKNASGIQVVDLLIPNLEEDAPVDFRYDPDTGVLTLRLKDAAKAKYTYTLVPVISDGVNIKTLDEKKNGIKLTVQAEEKTPKVTQSAKGKLDVLDPDSEIVYTISKISEASGLVTDVKLLLSDGTKDAKGKLIYKESDKFLVSLGETVKGKQTVVLKLDNTQLYEPSYKLKLVYTVDGEEIETSELSVKVTTPFKPLTVKYSLKSGTKPVAAKLTMNSGVKATVKPFTADELLDMINWEESDIKLLLGVDTGKSTFSVSKDGKSVQASVVFSANHKLEEGNIYHLALNVTFVCSDGVERTVPVVVPVQVTR